MVKIYRFRHQGKKVEYSHHTHPVLGKYTSLSVGKNKFISGRIDKKNIIKYFPSFVKKR